MVVPNVSVTSRATRSASCPPGSAARGADVEPAARPSSRPSSAVLGVGVRLVERVVRGDAVERDRGVQQHVVEPVLVRGVARVGEPGDEGRAERADLGERLAQRVELEHAPRGLVAEERAEQASPGRLGADEGDARPVPHEREPRAVEPGAHAAPGRLSNVESLTWFAAAVSYTSRPSVASMSERMTRVTRSAGEEPRRGAVRRPAHAARSRRYPAGPDSTITPPAFACAA